MTVKDLIGQGFNEVVLSAPDKEIQGAYVGDLLSWVMGRASEGNAWITIMTNINVIAVASLIDVSCVILAEGVTLSDEVKEKAEEKGVNILSVEQPVYETAVCLAGLLK